MVAQPRSSTTLPAAAAAFAPKLEEVTRHVLFGDVWQREGLGPRERSLVTVAALVASGSDEQLRFHVPRAIQNGVTREELSETLTHLAFYAGWPKVMSALTVVLGALESDDIGEDD